MRDYLISPSILASDLARLGTEVEAVLQAGADCVHVDAMDNHYVPNLSFGPVIVKALRQFGIKAVIDAQLMMRPVDAIIPEFAAAGVSWISIHPEATDHLDRSLQLIRDEGCRVGLALNPATPLSCVEYVIDKIDLLLLMSVNPGFGGQSLLPSVYDKLRKARKMLDASGRDIRLQVDGGVTIKNIRALAEAGADTFVVGTAIFSTKDYRETISALRAELPSGKS